MPTVGPASMQAWNPVGMLITNQARLGNSRHILDPADMLENPACMSRTQQSSMGLSVHVLDPVGMPWTQQILWPWAGLHNYRNYTWTTGWFFLSHSIKIWEGEPTHLQKVHLTLNQTVQIWNTDQYHLNKLHIYYTWQCRSVGWSVGRLVGVNEFQRVLNALNSFIIKTKNKQISGEMS